MQSRWILFGYKVINGKFHIEESESEIVREIFKRYLDSESLKDISQSLTAREITYFKDKKTWNKNMISRILDNRHYVGDFEYPSIISLSDFEKAKASKQTKYGTKHEDTPEIAFLKKHMFCKCCGKPIRRITTWGTHEKWMCSAGCKPSEYIDDKWIENELFKIVERVKLNPDIVRSSSQNTGYLPDIQVTRTSNEIKRLLDQSKMEFKVGAKAIFECASAKFDCCVIDNSKEISDKLIETIISTEELNLDFYENAIKRITVNPNGTIEVLFINDAVIYNRERIDNYAGNTDSN